MPVIMGKYLEMLGLKYYLQQTVAKEIRILQTGIQGILNQKL